MADRGSTEFEHEETGERFFWKNCEVPECPNQVCIGLSDKFCWTHAMSGGSKYLRNRNRALQLIKDS